MIAARKLTPSTDPLSIGGRLVAADGRALPLAGSRLDVDAAGGVARVALEQRFRNPHAEPLAVTYSLPLPADGAVSGFSFRIGDRRIVGEIDRKARARERYEQAIVEGRSAALLEQDRSSLFTQEIGNIPPGAEIIAEVIVDQRLRWLDEGAWEWRFPTVVAPRYLGEPGRVEDAARIAQDVADGPITARAALRCVVRDVIPQGRRPESPSHAIDVAPHEDGVEVSLRHGAGARLDRDVVVQWPAAAQGVGASLDLGRPRAGRATSAGDHAAYGLLTILPPSPEIATRPLPRDLIVLLDTSGSMGGEPLSQAVRVVSALVETLREEDQLELIEFSSAARRWRGAPVAATSAARREAIAWLRALHAAGGTEMRQGILEALRGLRPGAQRQVVLVTDGQIGFESQVVAAILERLPAASRLHTVGVGSAVNRSLTGPAARAGRGVEVVIGLGEDPERAAWRIVSRTRAPVVVELEIGGSAVIDHAPARLPDLFAGAPAMIGVSLRPEGGSLRIHGRTAAGTWEQRIDVPPVGAGEGSGAVAALYGREVVEDLETRLAAGGDRREIDASIERAGLGFQISTRLTSWVAITEEATVDPRDPLRRERMPHELPYGMSAEGLGLRPAQQAAFFPAQAAQAFPSRGRASVASTSGLRSQRQRDEERSWPAAEQARGVVRASPAAAPPPAGPAGVSRPAAPPAPPKPVRPASSIDDLIDVDIPYGDDEVASLAYAPPPAAAAPSACAPPAEPPPPPPPPAEAADKAKKGGGFIGAVKRLFAGKPEPDEAEASKERERQAEAAPTRRLRGRVALSGPDALVLEVTIDAPLDWAPEGPVRIDLDDGATVVLTIAAAMTTRAGGLAAGQIARLCVVLRGMLSASPRRAILRSGRERIVIDL